MKVRESTVYFLYVLHLFLHDNNKLTAWIILQGIKCLKTYRVKQCEVGDLSLLCFVSGLDGQYVGPGERHDHDYQSFPQILGSQVQAEES